MVASSRTKTADKQAILKKLLPAIRKQYKVPNASEQRNVVDTLLFAVCLENMNLESAEESYKRLLEMIPDLNEIRVSAVDELVPAWGDNPEADWKAYRIRSILQYVFEKTYSYDLEGLRKKTQELAEKQLQKIKPITPFVRNYTLNAACGAHLIPLDDACLGFLIWLGLVSPDQSAADASESLKTTIRKSEADAFCLTIRAAATDPKFAKAFNQSVMPALEEGYDPSNGVERLLDLWKTGFDAYAQKYKIESKAQAKAASTASGKLAKAAAAAATAAAKKASSEKAAADKAAEKVAAEKVAAAEKLAAAKGSSSKPVKPASEKSAGEKPVADKGVAADKGAHDKQASDKSGTHKLPAKPVPAKGATPAPAKAPAPAPAKAAAAKPAAAAVAKQSAAPAKGSSKASSTKLPVKPPAAAPAAAKKVPAAPAKKEPAKPAPKAAAKGAAAKDAKTAAKKPPKKTK